MERNFVRPVIYVDGKLSIQYANFFTDTLGQFEIKFTNLNHAEVWGQQLFIERMFARPLEHKSVAIAIQKHQKPLYNMLAFLIFMGGLALIIVSVGQMVWKS